MKNLWSLNGNISNIIILSTSKKLTNKILNNSTSFGAGLYSCIILLFRALLNSDM
jgi:hypothetical protein